MKDVDKTVAMDANRTARNGFQLPRHCNGCQLHCPQWIPIAEAPQYMPTRLIICHKFLEISRNSTYLIPSLKYFIYTYYIMINYKNKYIKYKTKYLEQNGGQYLDNIKIINPLGTGMHGTVYLVKNKKNQKEYAMKVEQIMERDMKQSSTSPVWREINFAKTMATKYPNQFMKIYYYENKKCSYVHILPPEKCDSMAANEKKYYEELFASPYCSIKLTSIVDEMLHNIIYKLDDKRIILDLFIQVVYICYLIHKYGYYHRDLHPKNIGVIYTKNKNKTIKILDRKIPTHGYLLSAIDYGMAIHSKYELEPWEADALKYGNDLYNNFYKIVFKIMLKNMIEQYPDKNINELVPIADDDAQILEPYLKNIMVDNTEYVKKQYEYFQELLYKIVFFDKFQEQMGINEKVELFEFIPITSVKYIVKHFHNLEKILKHLMELSFAHD